MRWRQVSATAVMAALLAAGGCGSGAPTAPAGSLTGVWAGVLTREFDRGRTMWQLTQTGSAVTGTWSVDYDGQTPDAGGSLGGTVIGSSVSVFLAPSEPLTCDTGVVLSGTLSISGTIADDRITGTHATFTCDAADSGTVEVSRQ